MHSARPARGPRRPRRGTGTAVRAAAGALRLSHTVGAAITNRRVLGRTEAGTMAAVGGALLGITALGIAWPLVLAAPIVLLAGWVGIALVVRALALYTRPRKTPAAAPPEVAVRKAMSASRLQAQSSRVRLLSR